MEDYVDKTIFRWEKVSAKKNTKKQACKCMGKSVLSQLQRIKTPISLISNISGNFSDKDAMSFQWMMGLDNLILVRRTE